MKRALSVFSVLLITLIVSASTLTTRYYLTELDFISNQPVPKSLARFKAHIIANYNDDNNLIKKQSVDQKGVIIQTELYEYDSTNTLKIKDIYLFVKPLAQRVLYGLETKAVEYIEYMYGLDTVKNWMDRFSILDYNDLSQLTNHAFYDVNAFQYGNARFEYDSFGRLLKEEWIKQPSGKTMRWWDYFFDSFTQHKRIMEYDSNGVIVQDLRINPDGTESIFWFTGLKDSVFVNHTNLSFMNESFLKWGKVVLYKVDNAGVYVDSVEYILSNRFLEKGKFETNMDLDSILLDNTMYDLVFKGEGKSGNDATERKILGVTFDFSPPIMDLSVKSFINEAKISFDQSELLTAIRLEWIAIHDTAAIVALEFDSTDLLMFGSGSFKPANQSDLQDSVFYRVQIVGTDRSGNISLPAIVDSIMFDISPPVVELISPNHAEFRNFTTVTFDQNEPLQSWKILIKYIAGKPDINAPYLFETDSSLYDEMFVEKDLAEEFLLNDGTMYRFDLSAIDRTGNISDVFTVDSVTYDITPPLLTTIYPVAGMHINLTKVTYRINEPLRAGEFRWEQTEGTMDSSAPHIIPLIREELLRGDHTRVQLTNQLELTDGSLYTLLFVGQDFAGNEGISLPNENILFDAVPPEFSHILPISGSALNYQHVSYTLSEKIEKGSITWNWTGGVKDAVAPHIVQFMNEEKEGVGHDSLLMTMNPTLVDGGIYRMEFDATDRAGNFAETYIVENILYDYTTPVLTVNYPTSMSFLPNKSFTYNLSETLEEGKFILERTGGKEDSLSTHEITLTNIEKTSGLHSDIQLVSTPKVVEGTIYKLSFIGKDRANNYAVPISMSGMQYDFTPPELALLYLPDSTDVNHLYINYYLSELLKEASITWERTGGTNDPKGTHQQFLLDSELDEGTHTNTRILNSPNLIDGSIYTISIFGKDRAENKSNIEKIEKIRYDFTAPTITLSDPQSSTFVPTPAITYNLSEALHQGNISFIRSGGSFDPLSPHIIDMNLDLRQKGLHEKIFQDDGPVLTEGTIYTISISGEDRAGNNAIVGNTSGVTYDAIPPSLTIETPDSSLFVNNSLVSFTKSEDLKSGTIIWSQIGGNSDPSAPHYVNLVDAELKKGTKNNYTLTHAPTLKDGAIYNISIQAKDFAGNESEKMVIAGVLYDITLPVLQIVAPGNNHYTQGSELTFSHSEALANGSLSWDGRRKNGIELSTTWNLNSQILQKGVYYLNDYYEPQLEDGGNYSISYTAEDLAGNKAQIVEIMNYKVDRTPPVFSTLLPVDDSFINENHVGFTLNEDIASGTVTFKTDKQQQIVKLQDQELNRGEHPLRTLLAQPSWIDGDKYTIKFFGTDFAGNVSDTATIKNINYDITPPQLSVESPFAETFINETTVHFTVDEPLLEGQLILEPISGSLVIENLLEEHLLQDEHELNYALNLEEKIPYSIYIQGVDRAGNSGKSLPVENVRFDITKPELVIIFPMSESIVNHDRVSYNLSEDLLSGKMIWKNVSDLDETAVNEIILILEELSAGDHTNITLNKVPELIDGSSYMISMEGTDLAGNVNNAVPITSYIYDSSPPVFTNLSPESGSLVNTVDLEFTIDEDLAKGTIIFTRTAGAVDEKSPHVVNLTGSRLKEGERGGVLPKAMLTLINGAVYDIELIGEDFAGNVSVKTIIENIAYDDEPPVVTLKAPENNTYTNFLALDYLIGEDMVAGQIKVSIDKIKEIVIELTETQLLEGEYIRFIPDEFLTLNDGASFDFELTGSDAAGNLSLPYIIKNVKYDTTHPKIDIITPASDEAINYSTMSINISENLADGFLLVEQTGGVLDTRFPHKITILHQEMKGGEYKNVKFANGPILQNGSIYTFEFTGQDFAGNEVRSTKVTNVLYDIDPPVVSLSKPVDAEQIKTTEVSYLLSDNLSKGLITFQWTSGTTDTISTHIVELYGSQLRQGAQMDIDLNLMDVLSDGARYKVSIQGFDKAGNESEIATIHNVLYDVLPPVLTIYEPIEGSAFNEPIVSFEMNEKLAEGILTFKQTGGKTDNNSPHDILILPPFNDQGRFDGVRFANDVTLQDGSEYSIIFNARDPAGNVSSPVAVDSILYDITAPVIETILPIAGSYLRDMIVQYTVDETLIDGRIDIIASNNPNSTHSISLTDIQLKPGVHDVNVLNHVSLVSGTEYTIEVSGKDRAGNNSSTKEVNKLVYDIEPPILKITSPAFGSRVNHTLLSFNIGEKLQDLKVTWIDDNKIASIVNLPDRYYAPEQYDQIIFDNPPTLISGMNYYITLSGTDMAGNKNEVKVYNVEYDDSPPIFSAVSPSSGSFINNTKIQFSFNEPLQSSRVLWKAIGGAVDPQSPRTIELVGLELETIMESASKLTNQMDLNDGSIYEISIEGTDLAGNNNSTVLAENISFDISAPIAQLISPENNSYKNHDNLDYKLDEDLQSGTILWKRIFGASDSHIHTIELSGDLLNAGDHSNSILPDLPLVSGTQYQIELSGIDLAGNSTSNASQRTFFYDTEPPQLTIDSPKEFTSINHSNFNFTVSEPIKRGEMIFTDEDGLTNKLLYRSPHIGPLTIPLNLKDGSTYSFKLSGIDFAGNNAESAEVTGIHYDITKPVFSIQLPQNGDLYVGSRLSYTLSEDIISGSAVWSRKGGNRDRSAPHKINLNIDEMKSGKYNDHQLFNQSKLNVSTVYTLMMKGTDAAGNESLPTTVHDIEYTRSLDGNWFFQSAIMTVVWTFEGDAGSDGSKGNFAQGIQMGTKISNQEYGRYEIDFSSKPWTLRWTMDKTEMSRFSIFEFQDENHLRVVTRESKKPKNWADGEVMMYEYR